MVWLKRDSISRAAGAQQLERATTAKVGDGPVGLEPVALPRNGNRTNRRASEVISRIQRLIEQGHFPPGSNLPPERTLATELGVGRPAIREAIKSLSVMGMVESRRGSGTLVKSAEPAPTTVLGAPELFLAGCGMLELLEARKILEPRAAWLAATRASEAQMLEMQNARVRLELHDRDWKLVARLDYELHLAIFRGAQNPVLEHLYRFVMLPILGNRVGVVRFAPDVERMRRDHRAIIEAVLKRQAPEAEKAMNDHLQSTAMDYILESSR
jgi:GntR family transcriptional regulator, transcriptional repressor for pyruvate dehydrogenase complex